MGVSTAMSLSSTRAAASMPAQGRARLNPAPSSGSAHYWASAIDEQSLTLAEIESKTAVAALGRDSKQTGSCGLICMHAGPAPPNCR